MKSKLKTHITDIKIYLKNLLSDILKYKKKICFIVSGIFMIAGTLCSGKAFFYGDDIQSALYELTGFTSKGESIYGRNRRLSR